MKFFALICSAKFWLTLLVSLTMSVGALAADIHPVDEDEAACQSTETTAQHIVVDVGGDQDNDRPEHEHHAHSCGSCHLHVIGADLTGQNLRSVASMSLSPGFDNVGPRAGPLGLYRPPRD